MLASRHSGHAVRHLALIALIAVVAAATVAGTAATPVDADHDAPAVSATLAGSLQSELGCPDDWSPGCAATAMQPTGDGSWSITVDVPAGSWEWKVALDPAWARSYPANNVPLVLDNAVRLTFTYDDTSHRVAVGPADPPSGVTDADRQLAGTSLRDDLTRERFYFVMADRFENGDPTTTPLGSRATGWRAASIRPTRASTTVATSTAGLASSTTSKTRYDRDLVDAGLQEPSRAGIRNGRQRRLSRLLDHRLHADRPPPRHQRRPAHARRRGARTRIKVFFDIITNHTADVIGYQEGAYLHRQGDRAVHPQRHPHGVRRPGLRRAPEFPPLDPAVSFPYTPIFARSRTRRSRFRLGSTTGRYYHNRGDATFDGESSEYGDFFGLDDLFTEHPDVVAGMTDIYEAWVDFGIDGFRIDTVKHVNVEFWQKFAAAIAARRRSRRQPRLLHVRRGVRREPGIHVAVHDRGRPAGHDRLRLPGSGQRIRRRQPTVELRDLFANDDYYTDADSNAYSLPTFLGNHDMGRIGHSSPSAVPVAMC